MYLSYGALFISKMRKVEHLKTPAEMKVSQISSFQKDLSCMQWLWRHFLVILYILLVLTMLTLEVIVRVDVS